MAKGGGSTQQTTTSEPWKQAQPYLTDLFSRAQGAANTTPQYFPGSTTVGELPSETQGWQSLLGYTQGAYGPNSLFGSAGDSLGKALAGNTDLGSMSAALSGPASSALISGINQGPAKVGQQQINPNQFAPQFGKAGSLDATGALTSMLSGTPDYSGVQGSIDAANKPLLDQFNNELMPSLNSKATFLNNGTGGIKALSTAIPELGDRMSQNALQVTEAERQRALASRDQAAGLVSQGGLSSYGMGLSGGQAQAGLNLSADQTNASNQNSYLSNLLGFGGLAGNLASNVTNDSLQAGSQIPGYTQAGQAPSQAQLQYGTYQRGLAQDDLQSQIDKWNFGQNAPWTQVQNLSQILNGGNYGGIATTTAPKGSAASGLLGGAAAGGSLGSTWGPWGAGIGAVGGGLLGLFS